MSEHCCSTDPLSPKDRALVFIATRVDMPKTLRAAVVEGANPNVVERGYSLLMLALWECCFENAKMLIKLARETQGVRKVVVLFRYYLVMLKPFQRSRF